MCKPDYVYLWPEQQTIPEEAISRVPKTQTHLDAHTGCVMLNNSPILGIGIAM